MKGILKNKTGRNNCIKIVRSGPGHQYFFFKAYPIIPTKARLRIVTYRGNPVGQTLGFSKDIWCTYHILYVSLGDSGAALCNQTY